MQFELSKAAETTIKSLLKPLGTDYEENVIRKAIALIQIAAENLSSEGKLTIVKVDGTHLIIQVSGELNA